MGSQVITANNAAWLWTATGGQNNLTIEALGGGGGSGGVSFNTSTSASGGGGRGGAYVRRTITKGAETSLNLVIGAAGGAGASTGAAGTAGGYSEVTQDVTVVVRAPGGAGGGGGTADTHYAGGTTDNGTEVHGDGVYYGGGNGGTGNTAPWSGAGGGAAGPGGAGGAASNNVAGLGNTSAWADGNTTRCGNGAAGRNTSGAGAAGNNNGGGASGGLVTSNTNRAGAAGGVGVIVLSWVTLPVLSAQTVDTLTVVGGVPKATTDTGSGTIYMVVVPDGDSPSIAQIKAGQRSNGTAALAAANQAVSGTGQQVFSAVTSLNASTAYDCWFTQAITGADAVAVKADFTTADASDGDASGSSTVTGAAAFDSFRRAILNGLDSAQSEAAGWDALKSSISESAVARTSSTLVTITVPALASYSITADETITATIPAAVLAGAAQIVASPTFDIAADGGATSGDGSASGSATVTAESIALATGSASAGATVTAESIALATGSASAGATATAESLALAAGSATGSATVTAQSIALATGSATGSATVEATSSQEGVSDGSASGSSTVTAISITLATGSATGTATVTATSLALATGTVTATATAEAYSEATFDSLRQSIINWLVSNKTSGQEPNGWAALRSTIPVTAVVRTSATLVTITVPALALYDIGADETITATIPGEVLTGGVDIEASPTFDIAAEGAAPERVSDMLLMGVGA